MSSALTSFALVIIFTSVLSNGNQESQEDRKDDHKEKKLFQNYIDLCYSPQVILIFMVLMGVGILGITIVFYYKNKKKIKLWLYSKQMCLKYVTEDELDQDKEYDAFVSFSQKDETFVKQEIIEKLVDGLSPYKLCLHNQDCLTDEGKPISITHLVGISRRTIIILTRNFLKSIYARVAFRAAHAQTVRDDKARLIVVVYGDIENAENFDKEIKDYLKKHVHIKWDDPWFWDKLTYALPHKHKKPDSIK